MVISSATGILLGWKKNSETLQPPTHRGEVTELRHWRPIHQLEAAAVAALARELGPGDPARLVVDRMNVLGLGLLVLSASGVWMWYGPKRLRRIRLRESRGQRRSA